MALQSTQQTPKVEKLLRRAAAARFGRGKATPVFEHGHWWVTLPNGAIYDAVDAAPSIAGTGFDFEQVSEGDDD